jgi:D-alanyl-D-alanine carboxypeptidase
MSRKVLYVSALALLSTILVHAQNDRSAVGQLDSIIERDFKATRCPGLSVAVAKTNAIIYSKAVGFADLEQGLPLKIDSAHRLASLSKPVTGTIVMDLVQSGPAR